MDGQRLALSENGVLQTVLDTSSLSFGSHVLTAKAQRNGHLSVSTREVWKLPRLEDGPDLPVDFPYGATREKKGIRLHLLAHNAKFVVVEWRDAGQPVVDMMETLPGGRWTFLVPAEPDARVAYRYIVNGEERFADPWSKIVEWKNPGTGKESHLPEHAWTVVGALPEALPPWTPPKPETWVIYELSIPDVAPPGSYRGLEAKLDYIRDLGINAIEPLPVTAFPRIGKLGLQPRVPHGPRGRLRTAGGSGVSDPRRPGPGNYRL